MSQLFVSGGQSVVASASVLPVNIQSWFPITLIGLIALLSKGLSRVFSSTTIWNYQFFGVQPSLWSNSYILEKTVLTIWTFVGKVMSLLFNMLSSFVIAFLPRSKQLLILWLLSPTAVILETKKIKPATISIFSSCIFHELTLSFLSMSFKPAFSHSSFTLIKGLFRFSSLSAVRVVSFAYMRLLIFLLAILIPGLDSSSLVFHMRYSTYKLNTQPWHNPFPILNQSIVPCPV